MRFRQRFCVLASLQEALTSFKPHRHLHCKAPEEYNTSLQGMPVNREACIAFDLKSGTLLKSLLVPSSRRLSARCHQTTSCAISNLASNCRTRYLLPAISLTDLAICTTSFCNVFLLKQAQDQFEQWHADKWLSPRRVLHKAGAEMLPVLLPFWLFEAAIKVEYAAQVSAQMRDVQTFVPCPRHEYSIIEICGLLTIVVTSRMPSSS